MKKVLYRNEFGVFEGQQDQWGWEEGGRQRAVGNELGEGGARN